MMFLRQPLFAWIVSFAAKACDLSRKFDLRSSDGDLGSGG